MNLLEKWYVLAIVVVGGGWWYEVIQRSILDLVNFPSL